MGKPYLAIQHSGGTLLLSDHDTDGDYRVRDLAFPAPVKRGSVALAMRWGANVAHASEEAAERTLVLDCVGDTEAEAEVALLALQNAVDTHRARLVWQSASTAPMIWTTIRSAQLVEESVEKLRRDQGMLRVTLSLLTDSVWTGASVAASGTTWTVDKGDRPARVRMKVVSNAANTTVGLGWKHAPGTDYEPQDTYSTPTAEALTASYAELATAPTIDTNANRGGHVVVAKVATTDLATRYRAVSEVTGSGVTGAASAVYDSVKAITTTARWTALPGSISIPGGGVPGIETGSGYSAESVQAENTIDEGTLTVNAGTAGSLGYLVYLAQTFPAFDGILTAFEYTVDAAPTQTPDSSILAIFVNDVQVAGRVAPHTVGTHKVAFSDVAINAGDTVKAVIQIIRAASTFSVGFAHSDGTYTDGVLTIGTTASTEDLTFAAYGSTALGFDSTVTIEANCTESSKTATLSEVVRLPADVFCAVWEYAFLSNRGVLIEAMDPLVPPSVYLTSNTAGTAGTALAAGAWHGVPRLPVGVSQIVTAGEGTFTITGEWAPCYSNAAAGSF